MADVLLIPPAGGGSSYTPPTYTAGSVLFADGAGAPTEDNAEFFYDGANLLIGANSAANGRLYIKAADDVTGNLIYAQNNANDTFFRVRNLSSAVQDAYVTVTLDTNQNDATILFLSSTISNTPRFNFFADGWLQFSGAGQMGTILPTVNNAFAISNALNSGGIELSYASNGVFGGDSHEHAVNIGASSTYSGTGNTNIDSLHIEGTFNQTGGAAGVSAGVHISSTLTSIVTSYTGFDFDPTVTTVANLYGLRIRPAVSRSAFSMTAAPTAKVHIGAGSTTANTAPLKITLGGALLATEEPGAIEAIDAHIYWTDSTGTRFQLDQQTAGSGADTALSNLAAVAINTDLLPDTNNTHQLGSGTLGWGNLYIGSGGSLNFNNGNVIVTHASGVLAVQAGELRITSANVGVHADSVPTLSSTSTFTNKTLTSPAINSGTIGTSLVPTASDGAALGSGTNMFSDLFLASGGVINFNNGNATITHSAGLLTSNVAFSIGTSLALTAGTIELGHASDTTISKSAAGIIAVEGVAVPTISSTHTITNKRNTKRVLALSANSATPAINTDSYDVVHITSQTAAITSFTTNLTGTPVDGDELRISITGTASVGLTFGASFEDGAVTLPTTTSGTTRYDITFFWNSETSKWRCMAKG